MKEKVVFSIDQGKSDPAEVIWLIEDLDIVSERSFKTSETIVSMVFRRDGTVLVTIELEPEVMEKVFKKYKYQERLIDLGAVFQG